MEIEKISTIAKAYKLLKHQIKKHIELSDKDFELYKSYFTHQTIVKKDFFLKQGQICQTEAFVVKGCFKIFTTDIDGKEHILYFAVQDWWITDIDSFLNQISSYLSIQAIEDSEVLLINRKSKEKLFNEIPSFEKLFRIMSQKSLVSVQRRLIQNHSMTAQERYENFIVKYPEIAQKLTNIQLASYLGVSHEFLSKIRNKRVRKK